MSIPLSSLYSVKSSEGECQRSKFHSGLDSFTQMDKHASTFFVRVLLSNMNIYVCSFVRMDKHASTYTYTHAFVHNLNINIYRGVYVQVGASSLT